MRLQEQKVDKKEVYVKAHIRAIRQREYRLSVTNAKYWSNAFAILLDQYIVNVADP
jgi:hypothetical protein